MSQPSANSFIKLVEKSGVADPDQLKAAFAAFKSQHADSDEPLDVDLLVEKLVEADLITQWQTKKFLKGKYKGFFLGKFKLLGHLGSGGMSSVYLARHKISNQLRAIKVLPRKKVADKSYLDRFYLEARVAASLNHPNVVRIYDICEQDGVHYMVMEYVKGEDLLELVKRTGPAKFADAARYIAQACEGLKHAHQRDLVHRDIKPANLLLTESEDVKILDLGLALVNQDDSASLTVLYNEKVMGTADYLSPEQAVDSHDVDFRSDLYSLGCTLYFLIVGHPPFPEGTLAQRIAKHQTQSPTPLAELRADIPQMLINICNTLMQKNAKDRLQSCDDVQTALEHFLEEGGIPDSVTLLKPKEKDDQTESVENEKSDQKPAASHKPSLDAVELDVDRSSKKASSRRQPSKSHRTLDVKSKWFLPAFVGSMILVLAVVLGIVIYLTQ
jgi:serine/threonine-protein kinase